MSKLLRILIGLVVLGVVALLAIIFVPPQLTKPVQALPADWKPAPGQGQYAARMADCAACHTAPGGKLLAGGRAIESPMGTIWASNITPDKQAGIGNWTLDQFRAALVDGVAPGGVHLYPAMPYENYRKLSEEDIRAIYSYLMTEVPAVANAVPETRLAFPFNQRWGLRLWNWVALGKPGFEPKPEKIAASAQLTRGAYLVEGPGHCAACHSPRTLIMSEDGTDPTAAAFLSGGSIGGWSAPDLRTAHSALQDWSDADLKAYLISGRNSHTAVAGEMTLVVGDSLQYMTDGDANAMVAFLRAISDVPPKAPPAPTAAMLSQSLGDRLAAATGATTDKLKSAKGLSDGERLYLDNCNACHMVDGRGADGVFPSLVGNSIVTAPQTTGLIDVILHGAEMPSTATRPEKLRMPAFTSRLSDADVAALTTFLRSAWGNSASAVKPDTVAAQRH